MGNEFLCRQCGVMEITTGEAGASCIQFAGNPDRDRSTTLCAISTFLTINANGFSFLYFLARSSATDAEQTEQRNAANAQPSNAQSNQPRSATTPQQSEQRSATQQGDRLSKSY